MNTLSKPPTPCNSFLFIFMLSNREVENEALQEIPLIKEQYQTYLNEVVPKNNNEVHYCSNSNEIAKEVETRKEFLNRDKAERTREIKELKEQFAMMNEKMYDIMAWNRKVIATASNRQQRQRM